MNFLTGLFSPKSKLQTIEQLAALSNDWMAWSNEPDGTRKPLWCKLCRDEGKPWIQAPLCDHIKIAKSEGKLDPAIAQATLEQFLRESPGRS